MRYLLIAGFALLLTACASNGSLSSSNAKEEIAAATQAWRAAYDSRDAQKIASQYAPDAVFWGTGSKVVRATSESIMDYFKDAGRRPHARVEIVEQHIQVYGDIGINTGLYTFSNIRDGKRVPTPARFSMVFHKRSDRWVLVQHHSSRMPQ